MNNLLVLSQLFFILSVLLGVISFHLLRRAFPLSPYRMVFICFSVGTMLAVAGTALIQTAGKTVFLPGLIPIALVGWLLVRGASKAHPEVPPGALRAFGAHALALAAFTILALCVYRDQLGTLPINIPHPDLAFYGRLSDALTDTGEESWLGHSAAQVREFSGPMPYHFFELWIASLVSRSADMPGTVALLIPVTAILNLLVLSVVWALLEHCELLTVGSGTLTFFGMLLPPAVVVTEISPTMLWEGRHYAFLLSSLFISTKVPQIVWLLGASALAFLCGRESLAACILLLVVSVSTVVAPAALVASSLILITAALRQSPASLRQSLWVCAPVSVAVLTAIFFALLGNNLRVASTGAHWQDLGVVTRVNIFAATLMRLPLVLPAFAYILLLYRKSEGRIAQLIVAVILAALSLAMSGAVALGVLSPLGGENAWQISAMPIGAAASLVALVGLAGTYALLCGRPLLQGVLLLVVTVLGVRETATVISREQNPNPTPYYRRYSRDYLTALTHVQLATPRGGYVIAPSEIGNWDLTMPTWSPGYPLGAYLGVFSRVWPPVRLPATDEEAQLDPMRLYSPFAVFSKKLSSREPLLSHHEHLWRFVVDQGLSFLILSPKSVLPPTLSDLVDYAIEDQNTHEKFVVLTTRGKAEPRVRLF